MDQCIYVIKNEDEGIIALFNDVERAKEELKHIYQKIPDYKHYHYRIHVYTLTHNEYQPTNIIYTYKFPNIFLRSDHG
ncbi:hypothetical protein EB093_09965 [bacterium]|nr:hypothetical protein [bacterium]